jgi:orotate phosphoribosyltransferase
VFVAETNRDARNEMEAYKREFIEFMVRSGALTFGDFVTKSGRRTPYFINTGNYDTGEKIGRLGHYYAAAIDGVLGKAFDNLYGPAYKGIPLCVTASIALAQEFGHNITYTFNRKEAKDHGEKGALVGYRFKGGERVVIIEDVTTAGTSVRETVEIVAPLNVILQALVVSVVRMERGTGGKSALAELAGQLGIRTFAIVTIEEIVEHLHGRAVDGKVHIDDAMREAIEAYRREYGAK